MRIFVIILAIVPLLVCSQSKHEEVIKDQRLSPGAQTLLQNFSHLFEDYDTEKFYSIFAPEFINYLKTSDLWKKVPLEEAIWAELPVASMDWDEFFNQEKELYKFKDWNKSVRLDYVGIKPFGDGGFQVFFKLTLKNEKVYGGRIFLHPSGKNGELEIHGGYG
ncbi:MAG: hypothetical protein MRY83_01155 [Flavobacteriales bacterium]|nr:hypothetical protein [Flavobacteriales bacterium]